MSNLDMKHQVKMLAEEIGDLISSNGKELCVYTDYLLVIKEMLTLYDPKEHLGWIVGTFDQEIMEKVEQALKNIHEREEDIR